jgi:hypothetical protein
MDSIAGGRCSLDNRDACCGHSETRRVGVLITILLRNAGRRWHPGTTVTTSINPAACACGDTSGTPRRPNGRRSWRCSSRRRRRDSPSLQRDHNTSLRRAPTVCGNPDSYNRVRVFCGMTPAEKTLKTARQSLYMPGHCNPAGGIDSPARFAPISRTASSTS